MHSYYPPALLGLAVLSLLLLLGSAGGGGPSGSRSSSSLLSAGTTCMVSKQVDMVSMGPRQVMHAQHQATCSAASCAHVLLRSAQANISLQVC
jgi:hypothetical protein